MPTTSVNGAQLYYELSGEGDVNVVLVHGAAGSHDVWSPLVSELDDSFRVVSYDRRGHGRSELPGESMTVQEHIDDLAALMEETGMAPAWVIGNSSGGSIVLHLAGARPDLFRGVIAHEPALFGLLGEDPSTAPMAQQALEAAEAIIQKASSGDRASAAEAFSEAMIGPGSWDSMPSQLRDVITENVPALVKDDLQVINCDRDRVSCYTGPTLLTTGAESPPVYPLVMEKLVNVLPGPEVRKIDGTGHVPQATDPEIFADVVREFTVRHSG